MLPTLLDASRQIFGVHSIRHRLDPEQIEKQDAASRDVTRNMDSIAARTAEVSSNIAGVSGAADETGRAAANVLDASSELASQAAALKKHTHVFLSQTRAA